MNSVKLANLVWLWVRNCSVVPAETEIVRSLRSYGRRHKLPDFIVNNATRRLFGHIKEFEMAVEADDIDKIHELWEGVRNVDRQPDH